MAEYIKTQEVKLFPDEESKGTQEVEINTYDPCGPWITVSHCGDGFSMSVENWDKLVQLAEQVKHQCNVGEKKEEKGEG